MRFGFSASRISILIAITGIILLFFIQECFEAKEIKISEISKASIGMFVSIKARAANASQNEKSVSFVLFDGNSIPAIKFNPSSSGERKLVSEKSLLRVTGKVQARGKSLEIIAEKVEPWTQR